jgi:hypothetical protein
MLLPHDELRIERTVAGATLQAAHRSGAKQRRLDRLTACQTLRA